MACEKEPITTLVLNADYKGGYGTSVELIFCAITNFTPGVCVGKLGFDDGGGNTLIISGGVVTDNLDGTWTVQFDIDQTDTAALPAGRYDWQVEISESGEEFTVGRSTTQRDQIVWVDKLT